MLMRPLESCLAFILKSEASVAEFSEMSRNRMAGFVRCSDWLLEKAAIAELAAAEAAIALLKKKLKIRQTMITTGKRIIMDSDLMFVECAKPLHLLSFFYAPIIIYQINSPLSIN